MLRIVGWLTYWSYKNHATVEWYLFLRVPTRRVPYAHIINTNHVLRNKFSVDEYSHFFFAQHEHHRHCCCSYSTKNRDKAELQIKQHSSTPFFSRLVVMSYDMPWQRGYNIIRICVLGSTTFIRIFTPWHKKHAALVVYRICQMMHLFYLVSFFSPEVFFRPSFY